MKNLAGITDEAGVGIETQIRVTQELGWKYLELRKVQVGDSEPGMIHDISDADFEILSERILDSGLEVSCFSSAIANWGKCVTEPFDASWEEALRCIPRMQALGCRFVRIMSFKILTGADGKELPIAAQQFDERARRLRDLVELFGDVGITTVHENCRNYGGLGWPMTLELLNAVPGLKLVYDTGNPVLTEDWAQPEIRPMQDALEFYERVKSHVAYVHIKDGVWSSQSEKTKFTFPGEGSGKVPEILAALKRDGYDGVISIEPHMGSVFHDPSAGQGTPEAIYKGFVEYGRRLETLIAALDS